jgi:type IV secretory pathway VirB3-like protein
MSAIARDRLFVALTRPQMFAGVTYSYFVINVIVSAEAFLIFRSLWTLVPALLLHCLGILMPASRSLLRLRTATNTAHTRPSAMRPQERSPQN